MPKISAARRATRERKILDATLRILSTHGYLGTNMRVIADAVGLTKGGLYAYFRNKETILVAVADRFMRQQLAGLEHDPARPAREQLRALFENYRRINADSRAVSSQRAILDLWHYGGSIPSVRAALRRRYETYLTVLGDLLRRAQAEGDVPEDRDPRHLAALILACRDGMIYHAVKLRLPVERDALTDALESLVGLRPDATAAARSAPPARGHRSR